VDAAAAEEPGPGAYYVDEGKQSGAAAVLDGDVNMHAVMKAVEVC
jgi:hypothetical protein